MVKQSMFRHLCQAAWFALTNGYGKGFATGKIYQGPTKTLCVPGLNCYSCPGALGSCPIGSLQAVLDSSKFTFSCYVFGLLMIFGSLLGRVVCGWLCPFGFVQDLVYKIPGFRKVKNLPGHRMLKNLPYIVLLFFVILLPSLVVDIMGTGSPWFCEYLCPSGTLFAGIPLVVMNSSLRLAAGLRFLWKISVLLLVLGLAIKIYRPFCKYLCPLGAVYGCFNKVALYRFNIDEGRCIQCKACQRVCGMDIKVWQNPNSAECIRCGACKAACPTNAISSTLEQLRRKNERKEV